MSEHEGSSLGEFVERVRRPFEGTSRRAVAARWALAIALFVLSLAALVVLSWLLRGAGLWGDLAFAIVVTTGIFWVARQAAAFFLHENAGRALPRAFSTTIFVLVGIPVAYVTRPWGLVLLLGPVLVWAVCQFVYWIREKRHGTKPQRYPVFWQAEVAGVALLAIVLFVAPSVGSADRVPKAVPAADLAGGEQDLALAQHFRPLLFFDSGERRFPLDIQDAIADDRVQMCRKAVGDDNCSLVENAELIDENQDYLELRRHRARRAAATTRAPSTTTSRAAEMRGASTSTTGGSIRETPRRSPTRCSAGPACVRRPSPVRSTPVTGRA